MKALLVVVLCLTLAGCGHFQPITQYPNGKPDAYTERQQFFGGLQQGFQQAQQAQTIQQQQLDEQNRRAQEQCDKFNDRQQSKRDMKEAVKQALQESNY